MPTSAKSTILVTGAGGNLGTKIVAALNGHDAVSSIHALHSPRYNAGDANDTATLKHLGCDLSVTEDRWTRLLADVDVIIHFAALNPIPQCSWSEAAASFDMTANLVHAAEQHGVRRFVLCSSNHVMGRYKDEPLASSIGPGLLTEDLAPAPGTRWFTGTEQIDAVAYASSKLMSERLVARTAATSSQLCEAVSVRVGWAQPGDNDPRTISVSGTGTPDQASTAADADAVKNLKWFRDMWLSNADLEQLFLAAAFADSSNWPANHIIINGTSANSDSPWSTQAGQQWLGYRPQDDIYDHVQA